MWKVNYEKCPKCNRRIWKTKHHRCPEYTKLLKVKVGCGGIRGNLESVRSIIKDAYIGKTFKFKPNNRTKIIRFFMGILRKCEPNDSYKAKRIRQFLRRFHLTNAEIHAILFHIGFRYSTSTPTSNKSLCNIKINGYFEHHYRK